MKASFGLPETVIQSLNKIFSNYPDIEEVLIYGSRAKGNFRTGSDIDLVIVSSKLQTEFLLSIESEIDDLMLDRDN